ncbi:MAG: hypothetical protein ABJA85_05760 [Bacteroidota bacterium]
MKKLTSLIVFIISFSITSLSQDMGYTTTDVGGEFQWQPDGSIFNLQLAFNAKIHHSFLIRGGYNKARLKRTPSHDSEEGNGWGGSLGYRYYFSILPKRFFLGLKVGVWKETVHWSVPVTESDTKFLIYQPAVEAGYTFLINDQFFITPHFTAAYQIKANNKGDEVAYGEGFVPMAGISAGWRF